MCRFIFSQYSAIFYQYLDYEMQVHKNLRYGISWTHMMFFSYFKAILHDLDPNIGFYEPIAELCVNEGSSL